MDGREFIWRAGQAISEVLRSEPDHLAAVDWDSALAAFREGTGRPVLLDRDRAHDIARREPKLVSELLASASLAKDSRFSLFGYSTVELAKPIDWHYDPVGDLRWPATASRRMDHRFVEGDVKWIWELNRLQHLPWLAEAWLFTGDSTFSNTAFEHLDTWIQQNPRGRGIAWRGAFEAGLRAISVAIALQGLRDSPELTVERYQSYVDMLAHSAFRCWRERSRFSSANNHLIGEMVGVVVVAMLFPELRPATDWEVKALGVLTAEADRQILPDGAGAEQSVGYQMATVELLELVAVLIAQVGRRTPTAITDAIGRSAAFLAAFSAGGEPDPRWGDSDQEFALRLGPEQVRTVAEHLGILATSPWGAAKSTVETNTLTAEWYRMLTLRSFGTRRSRGQGPACEPQSLYAADGGVVLLRTKQHRLTMDVGSLGYLSIAAHGHADALAITVSEDGQDLIGDPGTGSYYRNPDIRAVMRGTRAHPTVCLDNQDQSVIGGPFLWSHHARTQVLGVDLEAGVVDAQHNGYSRLAGRPVHRRWLIAPPEDRAHLVVDLITGSGLHQVRTTWPLHPVLEVQRIQGGHRLSQRGASRLQLLHCATSPLTFDDVYGDEISNLGWWSDRLEQREPAWWLSTLCNAVLPVAVATLMTPMDGVVTTDLQIQMSNGAISVVWREDSVVRSMTVDIEASARLCT